MLSEQLKKYGEHLGEISRATAPETGTNAFDVNKLVTKAATYYEKVRYLIDFKEDHMVRRNAIERMLKRKIVIEGGNTVGLSLLQELASGQYIDETQVTEQVGQRIDAIVARYTTLINTQEHISGRDKKYILSFTATDIERAIDYFSHSADHALVDTFYEMIRPHIVLPDISSQHIDLQLFCASHRALLRSDNDLLAYALWNKLVPEWQHTHNDLSSLTADRITSITHLIAETIKNPIQWKLVYKLKNETIYFLIIKELVHQYGIQSSGILENEQELETYARTLLAKKYKKETARIRSSGIRAVMYLFFTKAIFALAIELPYEMIFLKSVSVISLVANILFHPVLLLLSTRGVGRFDETNTNLVIKGMRTMFFENKIDPIKIRTGSSFVTYVFGFFYFILLCAMFGAIVVGLHALKFNTVSIAIFLFFLALVSYFSFRIRYNARRWKFVQKDSIISLLASIFTVPIIRTGRWLSQTFASINVIVIIMDFIIETPFKFVLNFSNQFISYLKDKTPELY